ncbi:MAG: hypothetical protein RB292_01275 [Patescibacteria group bacterium]|jgi:hypothetical protein|nr:hypothetical protein [Patescibacteria group bacterium]
MEITIDLSNIPISDPFAFAWWLTKTVGWIYPVFLFVYGMLLVWQNYIRNRYRQERNYILLAIDIPKDNEQTPRAVENIFAHLAGAHQPLGFYEKWWFGEINNSFSFEIVSIGGYIQFIVHLVDTYRDLIEAIIYAQYPDAEITEIEDYTKDWNLKFPNDKYDLLGAEIKLAKNDVYPIITYKEFEDSISQEIKDPMASILEAMSRIGPGEELWLQYVITPADNDWGEKAQPVINKIIGASTKPKKNIFDLIYDIPNSLIAAMNTTEESSQGSKDEPPNQMLYLTQGKKDEVAAIEHKVSKIGFHVRMRLIYIAEKPYFKKVKAAQGLYGSFKQFNDLGLNSLKPDAKFFTGGLVWFTKIRLKWRKNRILFRYKDRAHSLNPGEYGFILNTEELASLWHFPLLKVKAPLVKKTEAKRAEAPIGLPVERREIHKHPTSDAPKTTPPTNLPTS